MEGLRGFGFRFLSVGFGDGPGAFGSRALSIFGGSGV